MDSFLEDIFFFSDGADAGLDLLGHGEPFEDLPARLDVRPFVDEDLLLDEPGRDRVSGLHHVLQDRNQKDLSRALERRRDLVGMVPVLFGRLEIGEVAACSQLLRPFQEYSRMQVLFGGLFR